MNPAAWERAKGVITEALKCPASERETFIRARCTEPGLSAEILELLATYHDSDGSFLDHPPSFADLDDLDDDADDLEPGTRVGPYVVLDRIGRGGMGQVFLGSDPRLRRKVALKCLISSKSASGDRRARILHEARAAACITHPNIAAVHDVLEQDNRAFIVMEYVEGESLAARLKLERLPTDRVVAIGRQLASALAAAHAKGVDHRDLNQGNIQLTLDGSVKILDFGIAHAARLVATVASGASTTSAASALPSRAVQPGTPPYMSPEQLLGRAVDDRSDIYSLGLVLFEMATGHRPFGATDTADLIRAHASPAPRADAGRAGVPRALADVIARALEPDPGARFQSAIEIGSALEAVDRALQSERDRRREPIRRTLARVGVGLTMTPPVLMMLGFLSSLAFNNTMTRTGPFATFAHESAVDYFYWGLRSVVAPTFYVIVASIALAAAKFALRLVMLSPVVARTVAQCRGRLTAIGVRLGLDDPVVLAQALAAFGIVSVALVFWWFQDLNRAWAAGYINTSPVDWFRPLRDFNPDRGYYRIVMTLLTAAFGVALSTVIKRRRQRRDRQGRMSLLLLASTFGVIVVMADLPYRIFSHSECERVDFGALRCFDIGENGDDLLIYCPEVTPPRNRVVKRTDPLLHRLGIVESVFTYPPSSRAGS